MELPPISLEQQDIINKLKDNNIIVDSVAGSGKTTTNLYISKYYSSDNILLLTYNSKLKIETREKVKLLNINNMEVHSYHSFCVKYYDNNCYNNTTLFKLLKNNNIPLIDFKYDIIILDEAQDITNIYYELICKIFKDINNKNIRILIMGDKYQSIYDFNGSDERYIQYAENIFNFNKLKWYYCKLNTSFRITNTMSLFINKCMIKKDRIISNKISNYKPRYIICNIFNPTYTYNELLYYLNLGYEPKDIFILAPSLQKNINSSPVALLENKIKLLKPNINIYVPCSDEEKLDKDVLNNKLVFSTFHQAKGLERKVVLLFNFDASYFIYYKKNKNKHKCPNELYVATTRGIEHLSMFHTYEMNYLPFLDKDLLLKYCEFIPICKLFINIKENEEKKHISVVNLLKHIPENIINKCYKMLNIKVIKNKDKKIDIPLKIEQNDLYESVCELTGTAIPMLFEYIINNDINIYSFLINNNFEKKLSYLNNKTNINKKYNLNNIIIENQNIDDFLYISNCWNSFKNGYIFKVIQIIDYDWINEDNLDLCINRLKKLDINVINTFEKSISYNMKINYNNITYYIHIKGFIDCIDYKNNNIYEFKACSELEQIHFLQLACYMYMYENKKQDINQDIKYNYYLYNIITDEMVEISVDMDKLKQIIKILIFYKFLNIKDNDKDDNIFLINCKKIYDKYFFYK